MNKHAKPSLPPPRHPLIALLLGFDDWLSDIAATNGSRKSCNEEG
jgi:hypothetical protein